MSIGWLQLAWVAPGDVNFNWWMEIGKISEEEKEQANGRLGKKRTDASSPGGWYASGKDARPADDRRKLSGGDATYAGSQARISPASTAHMLSR